MSEITTRIRSAGHWDIELRPAAFKKDRIPDILELYPIVERSRVELRGWDFPHVDRRNPPVPRNDFIQQETDWEHHAERWRFYQSGLFAILRAMPYDWRDRSGWWPADERWKRGDKLGVSDALFTIYEVFEFAARLSNTIAEDDRMVIKIVAGGLAGRALVVDDPRRIPFSATVRAEVSSYEIARRVARSELLADPGALAVEAARELFHRFGRDMPVDLLHDVLKQIKTR